MWIKSFSQFIKNSHLTNYVLNGSTVVIDGQNFFYGMYEESKLQYRFGCESERYANYLHERLSEFQSADVKCYIFFKGGHEEIISKLTKINKLQNSTHQCSDKNDRVVLPIFMKEIYKQVLDELNINYVICEYEAKRECIAFARKFTCPIISNDIEFCFSGVQYIPKHTLKFNKQNNLLECEIFSLEKFMRRYYGLNEEKLAIFITLTDEKFFPENFFINFMKSITVTINSYKRIDPLLEYLSKNDKNQTVKQILKFLDQNGTAKFMEAEKKARGLIKPQIIVGIPTTYLENKKNIIIHPNDPHWFAKGVALNHVAIVYINLFHTKIVEGSWALGNREADDALLLSKEIIQYALDLLTNFQNSGFVLISEAKCCSLRATGNSIEKPNYEARNSVFENGWNQIRSVGLFEHFLKKTLKKYNKNNIAGLPDDIKLLILALVYFSQKKNVDTTNEVYCVLLSYVMLNIVYPIDSDKVNVTKADCNTAKSAMSKYFERNNSEAERVFDKQMIHPLVEFQHLLQHMNYLNNLCGAEFKPTVYSRTYNGTFVYKFLYAMKNENRRGNALEFVKQELRSTRTVLNAFLELVRVYESFF